MWRVLRSESLDTRSNTPLQSILSEDWIKGSFQAFCMNKQIYSIVYKYNIIKSFSEYDLESSVLIDSHSKGLVNCCYAVLSNKKSYTVCTFSFHSTFPYHDFAILVCKTILIEAMMICAVKNGPLSHCSGT